MKMSNHCSCEKNEFGIVFNTMQCRVIYVVHIDHTIIRELGEKWKAIERCENHVGNEKETRKKVYPMPAHRSV